TPAARELNGYRRYGSTDMRALSFIKRARGLGFSVEEVRDLLDLWRNRQRASATVKELAAQHLQALDRKIEELQSTRRTLAHLFQRWAAASKIAWPRNAGCDALGCCQKATRSFVTSLGPSSDPTMLPGSAQSAGNAKWSRAPERALNARNPTSAPSSSNKPPPLSPASNVDDVRITSPPSYRYNPSTTPSRAVRSSPAGYPTATTRSPTRSVSEARIGTA